MIASSAETSHHSAIWRALAVLGLAWISLLAVGLALTVEWFAVGIVLFLGIAIVTVIRPSFGLTVSLLAAFGFEPLKTEPLMYSGWLLQSDVSSWAPVPWLNFSPVELLVLCTAIGLIARSVVRRTPPRVGQLGWPVFLFMGLVVASLAWGMRGGGDFRTSLWETRSLFVMGLLAILVPELIPDRIQLQRLGNLACAVAVLLSVEIIWRRFALLASSTFLDLSFAHETPVIMNFVVIMLLARLIWPCSARQRLMVLFVPLILYAEMVTQRRAGWIGLDVGILLLCVFIFHVRRKLFFCLVVPIASIYLAYLLVFWNASPNKSFAQPARAVHSIFAPDQRDASSNVYRIIETANIRLNIRTEPLTGLGFGRPFTWYIRPSASIDFPFSHYITHNAFLWVWMEMGPVGFIAFLLLIGAAIVGGTQLLKRSSENPAAPLLMAAVAALPMIMVFIYVDISLTNLRLMSLLGLALGVIGAWKGARPPVPVLTGRRAQGA